MTDNKKSPDQTKDAAHGMAQNSSVTDKDNTDRPGTRKGQLTTNNDYDYRPDFGDSGGAVENDEGKVLDGKPLEQTPKQEGDKPQDLKKPEEKLATEKPKK